MEIERRVRAFDLDLRVIDIVHIGNLEIVVAPAHFEPETITGLPTDLRIGVDQVITVIAEPLRCGTKPHAAEREINPRSCVQERDNATEFGFAVLCARRQSDPGIDVATGHSDIQG